MKRASLTGKERANLTIWLNEHKAFCAESFRGDIFARAKADLAMPSLQPNHVANQMHSMSIDYKRTPAAVPSQKNLPLKSNNGHSDERLIRCIAEAMAFLLDDKGTGEQQQAILERLRGAMALPPRAVQ